jgi:hypothetical protein
MRQSNYQLLAEEMENNIKQPQSPLPVNQLPDKIAALQAGINLVVKRDKIIAILKNYVKSFRKNDESWVKKVEEMPINSLCNYAYEEFFIDFAEEMYFERGGHDDGLDQAYDDADHYEVFEYFLKWLLDTDKTLGDMKQIKTIIYKYFPDITPEQQQ